MAKRIRAIGAYRPKVKLGKTVQMQELVAYIAERTGVNEGELSIALKEMRDAVVFFNLAGRAVKLEGLGTYAPKVGLDGTFDVSHRTARELKNRLNAPGAFAGDIDNRDMIGKTSNDLVARWNEEHPGDLVED
jgi:nucleoid DNA-binding protein